MKERKCVYVGVFSFFLVPGIVFLVFLFFISRFVFLDLSLCSCLRHT